MTALTCPLCGKRPKRDDRGDDVDGNIEIGYRAALQCECGLRLERWCGADQSVSELTQLWRSLSAPHRFVGHDLELTAAEAKGLGTVKILWATP